MRRAGIQVSFSVARSAAAGGRRRVREGRESAAGTQAAREEFPRARVFPGQ
jgi:hypothetical protein